MNLDTISWSGCHEGKNWGGGQLGWEKELGTEFRLLCSIDRIWLSAACRMLQVWVHIYSYFDHGVSKCATIERMRPSYQALRVYATPCSIGTSESTFFVTNVLNFFLRILYVNKRT